MDLKEKDILGAGIDRHWYYRSKANAVSCLLSGESSLVVLDVGAGSGFFSRELLSNATAKEAWCVDISYDEESDEVAPGGVIHFRKSVEKVDADLVILMDVLEHVDDDVGLLEFYSEKVPSGARFLISVPAFQFLWSGHDVFLEHRRRYRLNQIEDVVRRAGLTVTHGAYYFGVVFPIVATLRLMNGFLLNNRHKAKSQLSKHCAFVNETLAVMCAAEMPFFSRNRLAGLTAFCLAEKP